MDKMVYVQRANVVLRIKESAADRYLAKGYNILEEDGKTVIKEAMPRTVGELQVAYSNHLKEIEALKAEIEELKAKVAEAPAPKETSKKSTKTKKKSEPSEVVADKAAE